MTFDSDFISKFEEDTKIGNAALSEKDRRSLQENLRMLSDWSEKWEMPCNINQCQILHIGSINRKTDYEMCGVKKTVQSVKDLGVTVSSNLKLLKQFNGVAKKASSILGCSRHAEIVIAV